MVCGSTVLVQGQFRRHIGTSSYLSSNNSSFIGRRLISTTIIKIAGVLAQILIFVRRRIGTAVVLFVGHGRLGAHITT